MQINSPTQTLPLSPQQAAQHLLNRRRARTDIVEFAGYIEVPGRPLSDDPDNELFEPVETNLGAHHKLILQAIDRCMNRRYGRLIIMMPPGGGKSTYGTVVAPSYVMGRRPGIRLGVGMYGSDIALRMGRRTRSIIRQPRYKQLFNAEVSRDSRAGNNFQLTNGSEYMADSLGGQFPGNRFDGAFFDDPLKGRLEANSEVIRDSTWAEYKDNFVTRLVPGGWLVGIMTHWHEEDPVGRILPEDWTGESGMIKGRHDGLDWEVLCLQAKCETHSDPVGRQLGEYLWPEWFDATHWSQFECDTHSWNALYQQRPRPPEGAFFTAERLLVDGRPVPMPYKICLVFAVIDSATKTTVKHDGTAVTFFAVDTLGITHPLQVLDWDYHQIQGASLEKWLPEVFERLEQLCVQCAPRLGSAGVFIEDKDSGMVLLQQVANHNEHVARSGEGAYWDAKAIDSKLTSMGKDLRAQNASPYVSAGDVKFTQEAFDKVVTYKGSTKNHLWSQVLSFELGSGDKQPKDCLDTFTYGCAIGIGGRGGF
jgi:hypothetical protein